MYISSIQFSQSVVSNSLWLHESQQARPPCPSPTPEFSQTYIHQVGDAIQPSHPSNKSTLPMRWPKYWSFSFSISPSREHPGLISLEWTGWISVQSKGLSRSSPTSQFKSINSSALSFLPVQVSHPYMTTGKTIALTRRTFAGKVMSLLMLSRLVITFLPRSKRLLISWLQSPMAVILEPKK